VRAGVSGALDRAKHRLRIVSRRFQPRADDAAGLFLGHAKAVQDHRALAPKLVTRVRIDRRAGARTVRYGNIFLVFLVFYFASLLRRYCVVSCVECCVGRK
jgi:hypothetical protein